MRIAEFDALPPEEAAALLRPCVAIPAWVDALVAGRPYDDAATLYAAATERAAAWTDADVTTAVADHPRIGERPQADAAGAALSRREQAGVPEDDDVQARLAQGNRRYEERFGRIYLVRAAGRSAQDMLALLEERLRNDDATEREVTRAQLAEIALLRLKGAVS